MIMDLIAEKQKVCDAARKLVDLGLVAGTWGNVSIKVGDDLMLITPSGVEYGTMTAQDIVEVSLKDGSYIGGKPSSERNLHIEIYNTRKGIHSVVHNHASHSSTVAAARREVPPILDDFAQIIGPRVNVADYALPGTKKLVRKTIKALKGSNAVLLANHGAICIGRDVEEAILCCQVLEKACKSLIEAEFLGGAKEINKFEAWIMHQYYLRKYSKQK
jgi:L-fuculose-phosphate aldolase